MTRSEPPPPLPTLRWNSKVRSRLRRWAGTHIQDYPWRRNLPSWQGLVVEVLLQRTRAPQVVPVFEELRRRFPTARAFGEATEEELGALLAPLGLRWRVPLLVRLAGEIGRRRGRLPLDEAGLTDLPGVGPYAAAAALSLHGSHRAVIIDANTVRLASRLFGRNYHGETRREPWVRAFFEQLVPRDGYREFNYGLLDLAMTVCRPRRPLCADCPLRDCCATSISDDGGTASAATTMP